MPIKSKTTLYVACLDCHVKLVIMQSTSIYKGCRLSITSWWVEMSLYIYQRADIDSIMLPSMDCLSTRVNYGHMRQSSASKLDGSTWSYWLYYNANSRKSLPLIYFRLNKVHYFLLTPPSTQYPRPFIIDRSALTMQAGYRKKFDFRWISKDVVEKQNSPCHRLSKTYCYITAQTDYLSLTTT